MSAQSYKNKVEDLIVVRDSFKADDGKTVNYAQVILHVRVNGETEEIFLSGASAPKPQTIELLLKSAQSVVEKKNILDPED